MDNGAVGSSVSQPTIQLRGKAVHSEMLFYYKTKTLIDKFHVKKHTHKLRASARAQPAVQPCRVHVDRTSGGHRHHRHPRGDAAAGTGCGQAQSAGSSMQKQSQTDGVGGHNVSNRLWADELCR